MEKRKKRFGENIETRRKWLKDAEERIKNHPVLVQKQVSDLLEKFVRPFLYELLLQGPDHLLKLNDPFLNGHSLSEKDQSLDQCPQSKKSDT